MNKIINEVMKKVNAEECMHNEELKDLHEIMLNDLVRYYLDEILSKNNMQVSNEKFENIVTSITNYEGDITKDFLLSV